jgi:hypothetical protein
MGEGKSPHGDLAAVQQRLARLERERWVWRIGAGVVLAGLYLATWATASPGVIDEVRARRIVVVDAQGKERTILGGASLILLSAQGKRVAVLSALDGGAGLGLFDPQGQEASIGVGAGEPTLRLSGKGRSALLEVSEFASSLSLRQGEDPLVAKALGRPEPANPERSLDLFVPRDPDVRTVLVLRYAGKDRAALELSPELGPRLMLRDAQGTARATLGAEATETIRTGVVQRYPESSLILFDKDSKVLWRAP